MRQAIELIKNHLSDIEILHNNDTTKDEFLLGLHYGSEGELKNVIEMLEKVEENIINDMAKEND